LTNALEGDNPNLPHFPFAHWLSQEANLANDVKRRIPLMLILGNPPYSGASSNMFDWIMKLVEDYKMADGQKLDERNSKWLQDDYVKFIRMGEWMLERNSVGILAFINNHSFLDNPTFRGMRRRLMKVFDKIYVLDLHGNALKKESAPGGGKDQNVFDIRQGVSINIFVKTGKNAGDAEVFHYDVYGDRETKFDFLSNVSLSEIPFRKLRPVSPFYFFVPKSFSEKENYDTGFVLAELFRVRSTGVVTARDSFVIDLDAQKLFERMREFVNPNIDDSAIRSRYFGNEKSRKYPPGDNATWKLAQVRRVMQNAVDKERIQKIHYRPFDFRYLYYDRRMLEGARESVMRHFIRRNNVGLALCRQIKSADFYRHVFITSTISESSLISNHTSEIAQICPLYVYSDQTPLSNLNPQIVNAFCVRLGLTAPPPETEYAGRESESGTINPIDLFDYVYGVLFDENYRRTYFEFLRIDFPRIPYPKDVSEFERYRNLGRELRLLHLLEHPQMTPERLNETDFPVPGTGRIENVRRVGERVYINETQYFSPVPQGVWEYRIGAYRPAEKWLQDRKFLNFDDVVHYQKIVFALKETLGITRI
jgi:predicted helicase